MNNNNDLTMTAPKMRKKKVFLKNLQKRLKIIDASRMERLKIAKENKDFRGMVAIWSSYKLRPKILSDKQRMAIHLMTDFVHNFSNAYIAAKIGVSLSALNDWRNDPYFLHQLDIEITRRRSFIRIHAFRNVHRAIMRGSMKDTWNYLKMSGDLKESVEVIDRTGEQEMSDEELQAQIAELSEQLIKAEKTATTPSDN